MAATAKAPSVKTARHKSTSAWGMAGKRFLRHKAALIGGAVIFVFVMGTLLAPWLTPYEYTAQQLTQLHKEPGFTVAAESSKCIRDASLFGPCGFHLFGTDDLGRDLLSRVLQGGRVSLLVGFIAATLAILIGTIIGATAAYMGGMVDSVLSRGIDIMLSLPVFALLLILMGLLIDQGSVVGSFLTTNFGSAKTIVVIIAIIVIFNWMATARLVRGEVLSLKQREFADAARALGGSHVRIIMRHLLPNATAIIIVQLTLMMGEAILIESGLSFLGMGIKTPEVSWGNMLAKAQGFLYKPNGIYIAMFPGMFIFLTVLSFNLLGDGLRDALDPRSIRK
jgi:peptide/nickel transport system permease protein